MKNLNTKGFTLVELIIVITILAILATIAFISFQGYSAEARDSKVKAEITNALKVITAEQAKGAPISMYVGDDTTSTMSLSSISVQGTGALDYDAGILNKTALGLVSDNEYAMGYVSNFGGTYQIAGKLEADGAYPYVTGNYNPRTNSVVGATGISGSSTLKATDLGQIKLGDTITGTGIVANTTVTKISSDLSTLTLSLSTTGAVNGIKLAVAETAGLINSTTNDTPVKAGELGYPAGL